MEDITYKGYTIELMALRLPSQSWLPRAVLYYERDGAINTLPAMSAPSGVSFPTEDAADHYAVDMAKRWIDQHADGPRGT